MSHHMEAALKKALAIDTDRQLHEREEPNWTRADKWAGEVILLLRQASLYHFPVSQLSDGDLEAEIENMEDYYRQCEAIGQGINSKDVVRYRELTSERGRRNNP